MQQTFVKSIAGNDIEFNKLLYPVRYKVLVRQPGQNPITVVINKSGSDWIPDYFETEDFTLVDSISEEIVSVIQQNEKELVEI